MVIEKEKGVLRKLLYQLIKQRPLNALNETNVSKYVSPEPNLFLFRVTIRNTRQRLHKRLNYDIIYVVTIVATILHKRI
jgi:hypothetical protein